MAKAHAVMRLPNGNTLFSTGAGAMAVEHGTRAQDCLAVLPESPARAALELAVQLVVARNN